MGVSTAAQIPWSSVDAYYAVVIGVSSRDGVDIINDHTILLISELNENSSIALLIGKFYQMWVLSKLRDLFIAVSETSFVITGELLRSTKKFKSYDNEKRHPPYKARLLVYNSGNHLHRYRN